MRIRALRLEPVQYRLREPIATSRGAIRERAGLRVTLLGDEPGVRGCGEALPLPQLGSESLTTCTQVLERIACAWLGRGLCPRALLDALEEEAEHAPSARAALDMALHDVASRAQGIPLAHLICGAAAGRPLAAVGVNAVCGSLGGAALELAARAALARGQRTLKLKVGALDPDDDVARLACLRAALGPALRLRIDANGAWSEDTAARVLEKLAPLDIELCEQPVAADRIESLARLHRCSAVPIAADESLTLPEGREACASGALASLAILKLGVLGGLEPARALATRAAEHGVRSIVTTAFDGPCGTAAALHLAAAVGSEAHDHGLDAAAMLEGAWPQALQARAGRLALSCSAGLLPSEPAQ